MFFTNLDALRDQVKTLHVSIHFLPNGQMNLIVQPDCSEAALKANPELGAQFAVVASPEELDIDFPKAFGAFPNARRSLVEQANEQTFAMKAAASKKSAPTPIAPAAKAASAPAAPLQLSGAATETAEDFFGNEGL